MRSRDVAYYLNDVANKLGELGGSFIDGPSVDVDTNGARGILSLQIGFSDGSRLEAAIVSPGSGVFQEWLAYSFHFMDARNELIFRYDSAPHHPGGENFPNHKHIGPQDRIEDHPRPSVAEIVAEIRNHLYPP